MAPVMQQKASVGRCDVYFGLDLCRFVNELCVKKRIRRSIPLFSISIVNLTEGWQLLRVSRNLLADAIFGTIVYVSSTYLL